MNFFLRINLSVILIILIFIGCGGEGDFFGDVSGFVDNAMYKNPDYIMEDISIPAISLSALFNPSNSTIYLLSQSQIYHFDYNLKQIKNTVSLTLNTLSLVLHEFHADNEHAFISSYSKNYILNINTGNTYHLYTPGYFTGLAYSKSNNFVAITDFNNSGVTFIYLTNSIYSSSNQQIDAGFGNPCGVDFSSDERVFAVNSLSQGTLRIYDANNFSILHSISIGLQYDFSSSQNNRLQFIKGKGQILVGAESGVSVVSTNGTIIKKIQLDNQAAQVNTDVNGKWAVLSTGGELSSIWLVNTENFNATKLFSGKGSNYPVAAYISPDGKMVVICYRDTPKITLVYL